MIPSETIEALDAAERAELLRRLADLEVPRERFGSSRRFGRMVRVVATVGAVALVPWTVYLATSLPRRTVTDHWRGAWVGFDVLVLAVLGLTAWWAWHRRQLVVTGLATSAVLLVCDAWFDVMLTSGSDRWVSLVMALLVELPVAALFGWAVVKLQHATADLVWTLTGNRGPRPPLGRLPLLPLLVAPAVVAPGPPDASDGPDSDGEVRR